MAGVRDTRDRALVANARGRTGKPSVRSVSESATCSTPRRHSYRRSETERDRKPQRDHARQHERHDVAFPQTRACRLRAPLAITERRGSLLENFDAALKATLPLRCCMRSRSARRSRSAASRSCSNFSSPLHLARLANVRVPGLAIVRVASATNGVGMRHAIATLQSTTSRRANDGGCLDRGGEVALHRHVATARSRSRRDASVRLLGNWLEARSARGTRGTAARNRAHADLAFCTERRPEGAVAQGSERRQTSSLVSTVRTYLSWMARTTRSARNTSTRNSSPIRTVYQSSRLTVCRRLPGSVGDTTFDTADAWARKPDALPQQTALRTAHGILFIRDESTGTRSVSMSHWARRHADRPRATSADA